jgi:hypothetical protein
MALVSRGKGRGWLTEKEAAKLGIPQVESGKEKRNKFGNRKVDGFDSAKEYRRYHELRLRAKLGEIVDLKTQVRFELVPKQKGERAAHYDADFTYTEVATGEFVVEDAKGFRTRAYILKRKLMQRVHGITIRET